QRYRYIDLFTLGRCGYFAGSDRLSENLRANANRTGVGEVCFGTLHIVRHNDLIHALHSVHELIDLASTQMNKSTKTCSLERTILRKSAKKSGLDPFH
ncbi:MAG TPA: hypothetical protein VLA12_10665, partial [Planctomycetaceae bacterium]|nr:hypothetical protein [Planctomycetaceae bacterium]